MGKSKKRIFRSGVLVSLMMFYFSCGKDVFPPDPPENFPGYAVSPSHSSLFLSPFSPQDVRWVNPPHRRPAGKSKRLSHTRSLRSLEAQRTRRVCLDRINRIDRKFLLLFRMKSRSTFSAKDAYCRIPVENHGATLATQDRALL